MYPALYCEQSAEIHYIGGYIPTVSLRYSVFSTVSCTISLVYSRIHHGIYPEYTGERRHRGIHQRYTKEYISWIRKEAFWDKKKPHSRAWRRGSRLVWLHTHECAPDSAVVSCGRAPLRALADSVRTLALGWRTCAIRLFRLFRLALRRS